MLNANEYSVPVRNTQMEFGLSLSNKALGNLLMLKGHQSGTCFDQVYPEKFLRLANSATTKSLQKYIVRCFLTVTDGLHSWYYSMLKC